MTANVIDPFGVIAFLHWSHDWNNFHFDDETRLKAIRQMSESGLKAVRTDILWSDVDRGVGKFDFSAYDKWIPKLIEHGLDPLILLHYNKEPSAPDGTGGWSQPPDSFEEFAGYVHATVNRYKSCVRRWEIWNEPNHPLYWAKPPDELQTYIRLLRLSREAAKAADPSCFLINGGLTGEIVKDVGSFYRNGGGPLTDALNIHTFINPLDPDRKKNFDDVIRGVGEVMRAHGDGDKRIWITEMGCPGIPEGAPRQKWFQGEPMNEKQQADWLDTQYDWMADHPEIERLFWAFYRDTDGIFKDATDYLGIVRFDLKPKPAFDRLVARIRRHRK